MSDPEPVTLDPVTEEVRRLTDAAAAASTTAASTLTVRCSRCHGALGHAGMTSAGPLFTSSWTVDEPVGFEVIANGRTLNRRRTLRFQDRIAPVTGRTGSPVTYQRTDGVMALLALPPGVAEDYPALLVRCANHGDTLLARLALLGALRKGESTYKAVVSWPATLYTVPDSSWLTNGVAKHSRETRRLGRRGTR